MLHVKSFEVSEIKITVQYSYMELQNYREKYFAKQIFFSL